MTRQRFIAIGLAAPVLAIALLALLKWPATEQARADRRGDVIAPKPRLAPTSEKYTLAVSLPGPTFHLGDPIPVTCKFQNPTHSPVTIYRCGFWPNHRVIVTDRDGLEPPMTEQGKLCRSVYRSLARDKNVKVIVEAGGVCEEAVDIAELYHYQPGKYRLKVVFHEALAEPLPIEIESDPVEFAIE